jgi:hypothetical protein
MGAGVVSKRRRGFLSALSDEEYRGVFVAVKDRPQLQFPDVHSVLQLSHEDGKILAAVMSHVVSWVTTEPTPVGDRREINKPALRRDVLPALQGCSPEMVSAAERRMSALSWPEGPLSSAEFASILLQQEVLGFVLANLSSFKSRRSKRFLEETLASNPTTYATRFLDEPWKEVLHIVREYAGTVFQGKWGSIGKEQFIDGGANLSDWLFDMAQRSWASEPKAELMRSIDSEESRKDLAEWLSKRFTHQKQQDTLSDRPASAYTTRRHGHERYETEQRSANIDQGGVLDEGDRASEARSPRNRQWSATTVSLDEDTGGRSVSNHGATTTEQPAHGQGATKLYTRANSNMPVNRQKREPRWKSGVRAI